MARLIPPLLIPLWLIMAAAWLGGCVSVKFEGSENRLRVSPAELTATAAEWPQGTVVWGGRILETANLENGTEMLILAVPLTSGNVPRIEQQSIGRFVAYHEGFLEPMDFAAGRYVSIAGALAGTTGEWAYDGMAVDLPVVRTSQVHLWPRDTTTWRQRVNFGVSIGIWN